MGMGVHKSHSRTSLIRITSEAMQSRADPRGGAMGAIPPREVEKNTSSTIVVNSCADFVGVPVISALFCNQAPSTILIV